MKIQITEGCTAFATVIDDVNVSDMSKEQYSEAVNKILSAIKDGIMDNTVSLDSVIGCLQYVNYEHDPSVCDQCYDTVSTTTWEI
jgi:hypothetical protein